MRNAPELWLNTSPGVQQTAPAELDAPLCPPCTGDCRQGRACPVRLAQQQRDYQAELDAIDRGHRFLQRSIVVIAVLVLGSFTVVHYWPALAPYLP